MSLDHKRKDHFKDRKSLKGVPDLRRGNDALKRKQSDGMRRYQAKRAKLRRSLKPALDAITNSKI